MEEHLILVLNCPSMPLKEAEFIINKVLKGLDFEIHDSLVHLRISDPKILARIIYKLYEESELMINQLEFTPSQNRLRVNLI